MRVVFASASPERSPLVDKLQSLGHTVSVIGTSLSGVETAPDAIFLEMDEGPISDGALYWQERGVALFAVVRGGVSPRFLEKVDDFIMADASVTELELRLEVTRMRKGEIAGEVIKADGLTIDAANYEVMVDGENVDLTYKEFELLKFLATNRGRVITRDVLLDRVWGYDYFGGTRTVDVHVRRLRAKLGRLESLIETVRNVGYRFKR